MGNQSIPQKSTLDVCLVLLVGNFGLQFFLRQVQALSFLNCQSYEMNHDSSENQESLNNN